MTVATGVGALLLCSALAFVLVGAVVLWLAVRDSDRRQCRLHHPTSLEHLGRCVDRARSLLP